MNNFNDKTKGKLSLHGATYTFGRIPVRPLKNKLVEIIGMLGGSLKGSVEADKKNVMDSKVDAGTAIANLLESLTPDKVESLENFFFENIIVDYTDEKGKMHTGTLIDHYDNVFEENLDDIFKVLFEALKVYYGNFSIAGTKIKDFLSQVGNLGSSHLSGLK